MSAALIGRTMRKCFLQQIHFNSSIVIANTKNQSIIKYLSSSAQTPPVQFNRDSIEKLTKNNKIVVFMKGNPEAPRCGFSNAVVQIMRMHGVKYDSHDVLENDEIRQGIKEFTNWPTIPQIFIDGEFVGGCDIMLQMHQNGELVEELKKCGIISALLEKDEQKDTNK